MHRLNISIRFCKLLGSSVLFLLAACQSNAQASSLSRLKPGDHVAGMTLTTGAVEAPPIWAFCSPQDKNHEMTSNCRIPAPLSKVAIGHVFMIADEIPANLDWAEVTWSLSFDEQPIDLGLFGTYNFVLPSMVSNPSSVREVFRKFTAWDVVLTDLKPGRHTLHGTAQSEFETYSWIIDLAIEKP
jgi:hypothetical protein